MDEMDAKKKFDIFFKLMPQGKRNFPGRKKD
jgi:hypothetical protein